MIAVGVYCHMFYGGIICISEFSLGSENFINLC